MKRIKVTLGLYCPHVMHRRSTDNRGEPSFDLYIKYKEIKAYQKHKHFGKYMYQIRWKSFTSQSLKGYTSYLTAGGFNHS